LPEIETLTLQLQQNVVGRSIVSVSTRQPKALNMDTAAFLERAMGPISSARRVGKSAVLTVPSGAVWMHLGVNGQLLLDRDGSTVDPVVRVGLDDGSALVLMRIFMGHAHFLDAGQSAARAAEFGCDP